VEVSPEARKTIIRRILVPIDESTHSRAALEAAVTMAAALQAEISCLYVEDSDILAISKYPFFREICTYEGIRTRTTEIERDFKLQAERIHKLIAMYAGNTKVTWKFEVRRGGVKTMILEQSAAADLTVMGRFGRAVLRSTMGSTVRHIILHGRGLTMFIDERFRLAPPVLSVYTGSELGERALDILGNISRLVRGSLEIIIPAENAINFMELKKQAESLLTDIDLQKIWHSVHPSTARELLSMLRTRHRQLLILPADAADHHPQDLLSLISRINNPVLLVR
jgi:nucleotide-binding universal stress UspA family protein